MNAVILCLLQAYFRWPLGFLTCWVLRGFNKPTAYISCTHTVKMLSQEYINQCYSSSKSINTSKVAFLPQWGSYPSERQCTCTSNAPLTLTYMHYPDSYLPVSLHLSFFSYFYVNLFSFLFLKYIYFPNLFLAFLHTSFVWNLSDYRHKSIVANLTNATWIYVHEVLE